MLENKVSMPIMSQIKQTKSTKQKGPLCFQAYNKDPKLYVVTHLTKEYR